MPSLPQLPILRGLQRTLDELAFGVSSAQRLATPGGLIVEQVQGAVQGRGVGTRGRQSGTLVQTAAATRRIAGRFLPAHLLSTQSHLTSPPSKQVPTIRAGLLRRSEGEWDALAARQAAEQFGPAAQRLSQQRLEAMLRNFELMCGAGEGEAEQPVRAGWAGGGTPCWHAAVEARVRDGKCMQHVTLPSTSPHCPPDLVLLPCPHRRCVICLQVVDQRGGPPASVKVVAYRQVKPGVFEAWSEYSLQLSTDKPPEAVTSGGGGNGGAAPAAAAGAPAGDENQPRQPSAGEEAGQAAAVKGKRYRLLPLPEGEARALPASGKVTVLFGDRTCEALLSLPASDTR